MTKADQVEDVETKSRRLPRGIPFFAIIAVAVLAFLAGRAGGPVRGQLAQVPKDAHPASLPRGSIQHLVRRKNWLAAPVWNLRPFPCEGSALPLS